MLQKTKTTTSTHVDKIFLFSIEMIFVCYIKISNKISRMLDFFPPDWKQSEKNKFSSVYYFSFIGTEQWWFIFHGLSMYCSDRLVQSLKNNKRAGKKIQVTWASASSNHFENFQVFSVWSQLIHNNDTTKLYLLERLKGMYLIFLIIFFKSF